ncbi:MAG: PD-(D/E)XK nuclease family protein, partial [Planctomycetota bacterium]
DVLYEFVGALLEADRWPPQPQRDLPRIKRIATEHADRWRERVPPPNVEAERRRRRDLERTVEIFVNEQAGLGDLSRPLYLEASIGMPTEERTTDIDAPEPVRIDLPGGASVRAAARIDRIDRKRAGISGDAPAFLIMDYKSGSYTKSYDPPDIFGQGRLVQHVLYMVVAQSVLRARFGPEAQVDEFVFFFPGVRTHGRPIPHGRMIVPEGLQVIEKLCRLPAQGAFPATDDTELEDCRFCDYRGACMAVNRDLKALCGGTKRKLANRKNAPLRPFVELRRE